MMRMSKIEGFKGKIKKEPEDFRVEEITKSGRVLQAGIHVKASDLDVTEDPNGKFTIFVMEKTNWNTLQALKVIAKKAGRGIKSVGFAGTKDKVSVSTQLCSIFGAKGERLLGIHVKDIRINGAWQSSEGVRMGDLLGNRFTIKISDTDAAEERINSIAQSLNGMFPNFFGEQRFGSRSNNVEIGMHIMKGEFEEAAMQFLTDTKNERNLDSIEARERLSNEKDFPSALEYFPKYLKYERSMVEYLSKYPTDYANALRRLPRAISLMFVHSVEAQIFNKEVESRIGAFNERQGGDTFCPEGALGFPDLSKEGPEGKFILGNIVGYESNAINDTEKRIMEELGISKDDFRIERMPELNCKGSKRVLFAPYSDFSYKVDDNDAL
ncbi:MAG: tRNA pseudouridine(13) synthase TruD, partial [Candidatus Marsarchaeota archaeon]|nr:tRNA pseudouridine(13) synthase TruD [Candidatus Marsarchaeota archaeon]